MVIFLLHQEYYWVNQLCKSGRTKVFVSVSVAIEAVIEYSMNTTLFTS